MTAVATQKDNPAAVLEKVVIGGDLSQLQPAERMAYYADVCKSVGLNPLTQPFEYINLNGKLRLYAKRDCTDQLRKIHAVSVRIVARDLIGSIYVVTAQATDKHGREDESTGAVNVHGKNHDDLANAYMKAETKAKRRVTLSICGLGLLDESEVEDVDPEAPAERQERPVVSMPKALTEKPAPGKPEVDVTKKLEPGQLKIIRTSLKRSNQEEAVVCSHFKVERLEDVAFGHVNDVLKFISDKTPE